MRARQVNALPRFWRNENVPQTCNERTEFSSEFFLRPLLAFTLRSAAKTKPEGKSGPRRDRHLPRRKPPPCFHKYLNETVVFSNRRLVIICSHLLNVTSLFQWLLPLYLSWFSSHPREYKRDNGWKYNYDRAGMRNWETPTVRQIAFINGLTMLRNHQIIVKNTITKQEQNCWFF